MPTKIERVEQGNASEVREQFKEKLNDRLESNADYQRRKSMTREEKHRDAVDRMTKQHIDFAHRNGRELTESQARAFAQDIGQQHIRKNDR